MKIPNKVYNVLKYILTIAIPAIIVFIGTMGKIYGFETETIILTISAVATLAGTLFGISCATYNKENK